MDDNSSLHCKRATIFVVIIPSDYVFILLGAGLDIDDDGLVQRKFFHELAGGVAGSAVWRRSDSLDSRVQGLIVSPDGSVNGVNWTSLLPLPLFVGLFLHQRHAVLLGCEDFHETLALAGH